MTDFTQKHYEQIAAVLNEQHRKTATYLPHRGRRATVESIALALADMFERDNPLFKRAAFLRLVLGDPNSTVETGREEQPQ